MLNSPLLYELSKWFSGILGTTVTENFIRSAEEGHSLFEFLYDCFACGLAKVSHNQKFGVVVTNEQINFTIDFK